MEAETNEEALWLTYLLERYGNPVTNPKDFYDRVVEDYMHWDQELFGEHFDFPVKMSKKDIIEAYCECQRDINGDNITRDMDDGRVLYGDEDFLSDFDDNDVYEGSAMEYLATLNDKGFKRWVEYDEDGEENDDSEEVDFIWV